MQKNLIEIRFNFVNCNCCLKIKILLLILPNEDCAQCAMPNEILTMNCKQADITALRCR